ncbi:hypothetical protein QJS66_13090 [Kocuria rhizophila]|nr:hypothetical protein QJS66_13090 [Kocuria rhizophila]
MTRTKTEILDSALEVLRSGGCPPSMPWPAPSGWPEAGVCTASHQGDPHRGRHGAPPGRLGGGLAARTGDGRPVDRLRAYVELACWGEIGMAGVALAWRPALREKLAALWSARMASWLGSWSTPGPRRPPG